MPFKKFATSLMVIGSFFSADAVLSQQSSSGFVLEEVLVTARKREENLQNTPIAVSAFTAQDLQFRQVSATDQLADITPNLTFDSASLSSGAKYVNGDGNDIISMLMIWQGFVLGIDTGRLMGDP